MKKTYKYYAKSEFYKNFIYDNCQDTIEIRSDGSRMRISVDQIKHDNQGGGGLITKTIFIDGREDVKKAWREYRENQRYLISQGESREDYRAISGEYSGFGDMYAIYPQSF